MLKTRRFYSRTSLGKVEKYEVFSKTIFPSPPGYSLVYQTKSTVRAMYGARMVSKSSTLQRMFHVHASCLMSFVHD